MAAERRTRHLRWRRTRRRSLAGAAGAVVVTGLVWLNFGPATELRLEQNLAAIIPTETASTTTVRSWADRVSETASGATVIVRSASGTRTLASAFALDADGFLITSGRALDGQSEVLVVWGDNVEPAIVVGYDDVTDISVLQLQSGMTLTAVSDATDLAAGDRISIVNPGGGSEQRTIADAASTSTTEDGDSLIGIVELVGVLGEIPPGSPAVDEHGELVGMTTATADDAPAAIIPIELARGVAAEIIEFGEASHPLIGITARDHAEADGALIAGAYVVALDDEGPAAVGGVEEGDTIVSVGGSAVTSMAEMVATLRGHEPGEVVDLLVLREGDEISCSVELGSHLEAGA